MSYGLATKIPSGDLPTTPGGQTLLGRLSAVHRECVEDSARALHFRNGEYLIRQDEPSDGIFVLRRGVVKSVFRSDEDRELTLAFWSEGDFVGAPFVLGQQPNVWGAQAVGPALALNLTEATLRSLIGAIPEFAIALVEALGDKAEYYAKYAQIIATQNIERRVASALLALAGSNGTIETDRITIGKIRQRELASLVGATRQAVSLALRHMRDSQLIEVNPTTIVVLDKARLQALVTPTDAQAGIN